MSCDLNSDSFHGTKKGGVRKTVSKRRAYVNTPSNIKRQLLEINKYINKNPDKPAFFVSGLINGIIKQIETGISMGR